MLGATSDQDYTHEADSGALNLFGYTPGAFDYESEGDRPILATQAAIALIAANREHQFESALASRDLIGRAKGIIMDATTSTQSRRSNCRPGFLRTATIRSGRSPVKSPPSGLGVDPSR